MNKNKEIPRIQKEKAIISAIDLELKYLCNEFNERIKRIKILIKEIPI